MSLHPHMHVHGAHDHEVEHAAEHGDGIGQQVAIFTAIMATIGAFVSYLGGATQNDAILFKNEAVLKKTEASNLWNYYQAKSTKGHILEVASVLVPPEKQDFYKKEIARYESEKKEIKAKAEAIEKEVEKKNEESDHALHPHHKLAQSMTLIQVAIALASVTVLTRKRWLLVVAGGAAIGGLAIAGLAYI